MPFSNYSIIYQTKQAWHLSLSSIFRPILKVSTGEEVYSIAILLDDYIRTNKLNQDFKIFATDVNSIALAQAGLGSFHINISNELEKYYLENFFIKAGDKLLINKRIREKIVFSNHNLLKDPPFIRMDLITCRNLLIYLGSKIQHKVLLNFQFALNKYGYLFLGNSVSLGDSAKFFKVLDSKWSYIHKNGNIVWGQLTVTAVCCRNE